MQASVGQPAVRRLAAVQTAKAHDPGDTALAAVELPTGLKELTTLAGTNPAICSSPIVDIPCRQPTFKGSRASRHQTAAEGDGPNAGSLLVSTQSPQQATGSGKAFQPLRGTPAAAPHPALHNGGSIHITDRSGRRVDFWCIVCRGLD